MLWWENQHTSVDQVWAELCSVEGLGRERGRGDPSPHKTVNSLKGPLKTGAAAVCSPVPEKVAQGQLQSSEMNNLESLLS